MSNQKEIDVQALQAYYTRDTLTPPVTPTHSSTLELTAEVMPESVRAPDRRDWSEAEPSSSNQSLDIPVLPDGSIIGDDTGKSLAPVTPSAPDTATRPKNPSHPTPDISLSLALVSPATRIKFQTCLDKQHTCPCVGGCVRVGRVWVWRRLFSLVLGEERGPKPAHTRARTHAHTHLHTTHRGCAHGV